MEIDNHQRVLLGRESGEVLKVKVPYDQIKPHVVGELHKPLPSPPSPNGVDLGSEESTDESEEDSGEHTNHAEPKLPTFKAPKASKTRTVRHKPSVTKLTIPKKPVQQNHGKMTMLSALVRKKLFQKKDHLGLYLLNLPSYMTETLKTFCLLLTKVNG